MFSAHAFSTANWVTPANPEGLFIPPNAGSGVYGWSGVIRGAAYQLHERAFPTGSRLFIFSDGLSEFPHPDGSRIGDEGLRTVVEASGSESTPDDVIARTCGAAGIGAEDALPDDVTIVCLDRRSESAASPSHRHDRGSNRPQQPAADHCAQVAQILADMKTMLSRMDDLVQDYLSLARLAELHRNRS